MSVHDGIPKTLDYATPPPCPAWIGILTRHAPTAMWAVALALYPVFAFGILPSLRSTSGSKDPQIYALQWAIGAVAARAAVALVRRERGGWSLAYIALYFVLPVIAELSADAWRASW